MVLLVNAALIFIALMAVVAIFAPHMADTLVQRIGLTLVSLGSLGMLVLSCKQNLADPIVMFIFGVAFFMASTARKLYRAYGGGERRRRITDRLLRG